MLQPDPTLPPLMTAAIPGIGGRFKAAPDDFHVTELPLYEPSGEGTHTFVRIEKIGISTFEATRRLAQATGFPESEVGSAGLKDARSRSAQWLSFADVPEARFQALEVPGITVLQVAKHQNKLKRGHLRGNRFRCVLRDVDPDGETRAREILETLSRHGVPNGFGPQRFGNQGNSHILGQAVLHQDGTAFLAALLGGASTERDPLIHQARHAFDTGDLDSAASRWPHNRNHERKALSMLREGGNPDRILRAHAKKLKVLYLSALQAEVFNRVVTARMPALDTLWEGDLAWLHRNGAVFTVEDVAAESPRVQTFEISASGPLVGHKLSWATKKAGEFEQAIAADAGLHQADFGKLHGPLRLPGARRPLRFPLGEWSLEYEGSVATVAFDLPRGCYATNILQELTKSTDAVSVPESDVS